MATFSQPHPRTRTLPLIFMQHDRSLARVLDDLLREQQPAMLDYFTLTQPAPADALTLAQWSTPATFQRLTQRYCDYLYRQHPDVAPEAKPVQSLWAQWYFGLLLSPLLQMLLCEPRALKCDPHLIHVVFHENGHPCAFWMDVAEDEEARHMNAQQRIDRLIQRCLVPAVQGITQHGDINARLIWNNMGFSFYWFLGELKKQLPAFTVLQLEQAIFFRKTLLDGSDNPLYRTMIPRDGDMVRRSCCQRYRIPDVARCGNCTLSAAAPADNL